MGTDNKLDFSLFRQLLEQKHSEILDEIEATKARQNSSDISNPDRDDLAMDFASKERKTILMSQMEEQLKQVQAALQRIEEGCYGSCSHCGNQISKARLEALPHASLCLECQVLQERLVYR